MSESEVLEYIEQNADEVAGMVMKMVREALAKQIPIKPEKGKDADGIEFHACPKCFGIVMDGAWSADYCPDCGQRIEWEEKEDGSRTD